jgi:hypothetical protein
MNPARQRMNSHPWYRAVLPPEQFSTRGALD